MDRHQEHYIGIDVGTGSARACIIDYSGEIKGLAAQEIKLWQPVSGYEASHYVSEDTEHRQLDEILTQPLSCRSNQLRISGTQFATV